MRAKYDGRAIEFGGDADQWIRDQRERERERRRERLRTEKEWEREREVENLEKNEREK
jgi:hypothetical protein